MEEQAREFVDELSVVEPTDIGSEARRLDRRRTASERSRLPRSTRRRLGLLAIVYAIGVVGIGLYASGEPSAKAMPIYPLVVAAAFAFELMDSASGMGFGTALAPSLFLLGFDPLQVTPALLASETVTGFIAGGIHHEFENVTYSFRPLNDAAKTMLLLGGIGAIGTIGSVVLVYYALAVPRSFIELYVSALVLVMGLLGLIRARIRPPIRFRSRRLLAFASLAGFNKGIGGGGFGPVVTLGLILSGVYEKSATAIATLSESIVSVVGVATFFVLTTQGVAVELTLLPSIFAGGFLAAVGAPYLVRIVPNQVWRYVIPLYAALIGIAGVTFGLGV